MIVVPFKAEHFWAIEEQPSQSYVKRLVEASHVKKLEEMQTYSVLEGDKVLACFGWSELYSHRALIWAFISKHAGPHMMGLTRVGKRMIKGLTYRRIEMEVDCEFEAGHRWARMLGFTQEAECLRGFRMDGGDTAIYARIQ
jgi:hypothetical protein